MKTRIAVVLLMVLFAITAEGEYWTDVTDRPVVCCESRSGCQVLQMVLMGSFAGLDPNDGLDARVLSAVLPMLREVAEQDFEHFQDEFSTDAELTRKYYYIALGNCVWADILVSPEPDDPEAAAARRVLLLFLNPDGEQDGAYQISLIRNVLSDEMMQKLADGANLPFGFIDYVMNAEDWKKPY